MSILIAEDDAVCRCMLEEKLRKWGYDVIVTTHGAAALEILEQSPPPELAILDWIMPQIDGLQVCQKIRSADHDHLTYLILLTVKGSKTDVVKGLNAGADDYLSKPFDWDELHARLQVGLRMVELQRSLAQRLRELQESQAKIKVLQGLLPICGYCKKIRDDHNYWRQIEAYITMHSEAQFSHGICPSCFESVVKPDLEKVGVPFDNKSAG